MNRLIIYHKASTGYFFALNVHIQSDSRRRECLLPGIGTFASAAGALNGAAINDSGQVLFVANLTSGDTVLVVATPTP